MNLLATTPHFTTEQASVIASRDFGIDVLRSRELESERDQNFRITASDDREFVLKISNAAESREFLDGQNAMMAHLADRMAMSPSVVKSVHRESIATIRQNDHEYLVRLVTFLPGQPMSGCRFVALDLLGDLGRHIATMDHALANFEHASFHREFHWDLACAESVIRQRIQLVEDKQLRSQVELLLQRFTEHTGPILDELPKSIIHNDANDGNIVVADPEDGRLHANRIRGLVDFGDAVYTWTVCDLAIAIAYAILTQRDPLSAARAIVKSYHEVRPLSEREISALFGLVCMRLCTSVVIAAEQIIAQPDNEYLLVSQEPIRRTLPKLARISFPFAECYFRHAVGLPACSQSEAVTSWLKQNQSDFAFPVNPESTGRRPFSDETLVLDLGVDSYLIPSNIDDVSEPELTQIVFGQRDQYGAKVVIGRYLEPRVLYSSSHFVGNDLAEENRTIHLGIDIFAEAGTDVVAPLDGTVHFSGVIDKPLDYGGLILLKHATDTGEPFFSLYGHLNPESFAGCSAGDRVRKGQKIAELGEPSVNGGWTPHLHFQLMLDLLGHEHEFPGVAYASQSDVWSAVSPDPNLILGIDQDCFPAARPSKPQTLATRRERIGPSLSIGYQDPVKVVRGWKQHLFDETGRRFLDAYNNVPHVGHCHPHVVDAVHRQMSLLNTNTRYLHDNINELAQKLAATMPDGLEVCFFVSSASEANELALRLARNYTGARDMLVLEAAYHGHTTSLIDISPYKHDGPGGSGSPEWVHTVPVADTYRGRYRNPETAAEDYAGEVQTTIAGLNRNLCGFIFESCPSVGGQILFPDGYLKLAFEHVRAAGGLCIADDVQTGYGRLGSHMYGFTMQDVIPDIVILGKPIGNGHPLAAVVTTREIANTFNNGMEFFSTFGGNPVSCAAGLAVLEVLEREPLQQNALNVGQQMLDGLRALQNEFPLIGDIRGRGFFLGVELVTDHQSRGPASREAKFVANECRRLGVLIGTDGPDHNVLKIRPPMCFGPENARELLIQLRRALEAV